MNVDGHPYRTIWLESPGCVRIIDQALLPHEFAFMDLRTPADMCAAIRHMNLRGAGLIGCAAAWGLYLAAFQGAELPAAAAALQATNPSVVPVVSTFPAFIATSQSKPCASSM